MNGIRTPSDKDEEEKLKKLIEQGFGKTVEEVMTKILGDDVCKSIIDAAEIAISQAIESGESIDIDSIVIPYLEWQELHC